MTPECALHLHKSVLAQIIAEEFYSYIVYSLMKESRYSNIETTSQLHVINCFWDDFWYALPDANHIQVPVFFRVCDLAEGSYLR